MLMLMMIKQHTACQQKKVHFSAFAGVRKQWRDRHLLAVVWEELVLIKRRRKR